MIKTVQVVTKNTPKGQINPKHNPKRSEETRQNLKRQKSENTSKEKRLGKGKMRQGEAMVIHTKPIQINHSSEVTRLQTNCKPRNTCFL